MKHKINRFLSLALILSALLTAGGCSKDEAKKLKSTDEELTAVKVIDGYEVPMELYRYVAMNYRNDYEASAGKDLDEQALAEIWLGEEGQALLDRLNASVDETLIALYTPLSLCREYGIDPNDPYIRDAVDAQMDMIYEDTFDSDFDLYRSELDANWMNDSVYRFLTRNDILEEELLSKMADRGEFPIEDDELRAVIDSDEFIRVKQILVSSDNGKSDEDNRARAGELLEMALSGEDFDEVVQRYGTDLYMLNNTDGYYMTRGSYYEAFEDAAFALEIGEISGVVETPAGYSILQRCEKEKAYIDAHFDDLADSYISSQFNLKMEAREAELTVSDTEKGKNYSIFNMKMGD